VTAEVDQCGGVVDLVRQHGQLVVNPFTNRDCNRAGHYIFALWFLSIFYLFFPRLISAATDWMSTILLHMAWP